jgi:hypothetical protein
MWRQSKEQFPKEENENPVEEKLDGAETESGEKVFDNGEGLKELQKQHDLETSVGMSEAREEIDKSMQEWEDAKKGFGDIFDTHENGAERVKDILSRIKPFLESQLVATENIQEALKECLVEENKDEFIKKAFLALESIINFKTNNPEEFEKIQREAFVEQGGFEKINEVLSYGKEGNNIHIHLAPSMELRAGLRGQVMKGLEELADIIEKNKEIKNITATSWIVAEHPKLMEKLGFRVNEEVSEELRRERFPGEERKMAEASMTREEFLEKYGK